MITTTNNQYFVILYQSELEKLQSEAQLDVYQAIKSFSANGSIVIALSSSDIATRCHLSARQARRIVPDLISLGMTEIVGHEKRRGGSVPIYKVKTGYINTRKSDIDDQLYDIKSDTSDQLNKESRTNTTESRTSLGTKVIQSNKVIRESKYTTPESITQKELISISHEYKVNAKDLELELRKFKNQLPERDKQPSNYLRSFKNWVINAIKWKHLTPEKTWLEQAQDENPDIPDLERRIH